MSLDEDVDVGEPDNADIYVMEYSNRGMLPSSLVNFIGAITFPCGEEPRIELRPTSVGAVFPGEPSYQRFRCSRGFPESRYYTWKSSGYKLVLDIEIEYSYGSQVYKTEVKMDVDFANGGRALSWEIATAD